MRLPDRSWQIWRFRGPTRQGYRQRDGCPFAGPGHTVRHHGDRRVVLTWLRKAPLGTAVSCLGSGDLRLWSNRRVDQRWTWWGAERSRQYLRAMAPHFVSFGSHDRTPPTLAGGARRHALHLCRPGQLHYGPSTQRISHRWSCWPDRRLDVGTDEPLVPTRRRWWSSSRCRRLKTCSATAVDGSRAGRGCRAAHGADRTHHLGTCKR